MLEKNHVEEFYLILVLLLSHIIFLLRGSLAYKYFLHTPTYTKQFHLPLKMCDQDQQHLTIFSTTIKTSNSFPSPVLCDSPQVQVPKGTLGHDHYHQRQEEPADLLLMSGSSTSSKSDHTVVRRMMASDRTVESKPGRVSQAPHHEQLYSQVSSGNNSPGGVMRVCSACSTTKTPLWRSGPLGPKSLCNACGIRRRKARRADAAAAAAASDGNRILPYKKRCKILGGGTAHQKLHFDDIGLSLGNSSALHQVFPEDEKDAAILLMALSSGLIHG